VMGDGVTIRKTKTGIQPQVHSHTPSTARSQLILPPPTTADGVSTRYPRQ
jgi:hypothetical protein